MKKKVKIVGYSRDPKRVGDVVSIQAVKSNSMKRKNIKLDKVSQMPSWFKIWKDTEFNPKINNINNYLKKHDKRLLELEKNK